MHACIKWQQTMKQTNLLGFWLLCKSPQVVKQISSFNTNNGLGRSEKGSRHNPPLPEYRATPGEWLADATLLCQSISIWRASVPYSYMLLHQLYVLYFYLLYTHDMSLDLYMIWRASAPYLRSIYCTVSLYKHD